MTIWENRQLVTVGWPPADGWSMDGGRGKRGWTVVRNALDRIAPGDRIVARLPGNRIGRVGQVVDKFVRNDQWRPVIPRSKEWTGGEQGRHIVVRWDFTIGPPVRMGYGCKVPPAVQLSPWQLRRTILEIERDRYRAFKQVLRDESNWAPVSGNIFAYEEALSDYIATFPEQLEQGLRPYPFAKIREKITSGRDRLDVLLIDENEVPVVVECKQDAASLAHLAQLRAYMKSVGRRLGQSPRGILVFGGSPNVSREVRRAAKKRPRIELFAYRLDVGFLPCRID